jgi:hypothetical protein
VALLHVCQDLGRAGGTQQQAHVRGADPAVGEGVVAKPLQQAFPLPRAQQDDREIPDRPGLDERERLEELVQERAPASRAPALAASMRPGPPPVMIAYPARPRVAATSRTPM